MGKKYQNFVRWPGLVDKNTKGNSRYHLSKIKKKEEEKKEKERDEKKKEGKEKKSEAKSRER